MPRKKVDRERFSVNREEYEALTALRDGAHEELRAKHLKLQNQYAEVLEVNKEQVNRLTRNMLEVDHVRENLKRLEARDKMLTERTTKLELELADAKKLATEAETLRQQVTELSTRLGVAYPTFGTSQPSAGGAK